ncbi:MAG: GAF domain-containing protein [Actinomycetota bacterium]|nr:GAF domain-containing protein [Actinomycetota bacterium]
MVPPGDNGAGNNADRSVPCFDQQVRALAQASHHAPDRSELFDVCAATLAAALGADLVLILEYEAPEGRLALRNGRGLPEELYGRTYIPAGLLSQAGRALLDPSGRPVALEDFSRPHDWTDDPFVTGHGARSGGAVRVGAAGRTFGVLEAFYRKPRPLPREEVEFLAQAAGLLAAGLLRLECGEAAIAWRSRAELLRSGAALLRVPAGIDELLTAAVLAAVSGGAGGSRPLADWCLADALEPNGTAPKLRRVAVDHASGAPEHLQEAFSAPLAPTAPHGAPRAYATRQPELVRRTDEAFVSGVTNDPKRRRAVEEAGPFSYVCAPVQGRERFYGALGFLRVEDGTPVPYDDADLAACAEFAALVGAAIDAGLPNPDIEEARNAVNSFADPIEHVPTHPTDREREVLELIAEGKRLIDIQAILHIHYQTVRTHKRHLCQKLGISTRSPTVKLIAEARRRGWLPT